MHWCCTCSADFFNAQQTNHEMYLYHMWLFPLVPFLTPAIKLGPTPSALLIYIITACTIIESLNTLKTSVNSFK